VWDARVAARVQERGLVVGTEGPENLLELGREEGEGVGEEGCVHIRQSRPYIRQSI